jgi:hypothetical protein
MATIDLILDSLERRVERRKKRLESSEAVVVEQSRNGAVDPRAKASYAADAARYDEARLAFNSALEIDKATRKEPKS